MTGSQNVPVPAEQPPGPAPRPDPDGQTEAPGPIRAGADLKIFVGALVTAALLTPLSRLLLADPALPTAMFWPLTGIGLAFLLRLPPRRWAAVLVGLALGQTLTGLALGAGGWQSIVPALSTVAELLIVALLTRRRLPRGAVLDSPAAAAKLTVCALIGIAVGAAVAAGLWLPVGHPSTWDLWQLWEGHVRGHLLGLLMVSPMFLSGPGPRLPSAREYRLNLEWLLQLGTVALVTAGVFATDQQLIPALVCVLPLLWGGLRLGAVRAMGSLLVMATITTIGTLHGIGPIVQEPPAAQALGLQMTLATATLLTLFVVLAAQAKADLLELTRAGSADLVAAERIAGLGSSVLDMSTGEVRWSDGLYEQLGITREQMPPDVEAYLAMLHPDDRQVVLSSLEQVARTGEIPSMEFRLQRPDGLERTVLGRSRVEFDEHGHPHRVRSTILDVTESRAAEAALRKAHRQLTGVLNAVEDVAIIGVDATDLVITFWGTGAEKLLGWRAEEVIGIHRPSIYHAPEEMARAVLQTGIEDPLLAIGATLLATGHDSSRWICVRKDGSRFTAQGNLSQLVDEDGQALTYFAVIIDLTRALQSEADLQESEDRFRLSFDVAPIAMAIVSLEASSPDRIQRVNPALCRFTGRKDADLVGLRLNELMTPAHAEAATEALRDLVSEGQDTGTWEWSFHRADGGELWGALSASVVRPSDGRDPYLIAMIEDITARMQLTERLRHEASHDPLTGLPNRAVLRRRLVDELRPVGGNTTDTGEPVALLYIDLDGFKTVNDTLGHSIGDELLIQVAERISACVRASDVVARLGGDEFAVLLPRVGDVETARTIGDRIVLALAETFTFGTAVCRIGASIGIAVSIAQDTSETAADLLNAADEAMYQAKRTGKGRISVSAR